MQLNASYGKVYNSIKCTFVKYRRKKNIYIYIYKKKVGRIVNDFTTGSKSI